MQTHQADYFGAYRTMKMMRDTNGVLVVEFHSNGGRCTFSAQHHTEVVDERGRRSERAADRVDQDPDHRPIVASREYARRKRLRSFVLLHRSVRYQMKERAVRRVRKRSHGERGRCPQVRYPFGATEAVTTVRQYDASTGRLVRVFRPDDSVQFHRPRGLRFGPGGNLFCVAQDEVVGFDFATGACLGTLVRYPNLNGMALELF
jgi:hypothetical protein